MHAIARAVKSPTACRR